MAVKEPPPPGLLERFDKPLWERLRLVEPRPLWIVRSQHRGYEWIAIELQYDSLAIFSEGPDTTTVFAAKLPEWSDEWFLSSERITPHRQVCVDREYVYLAELGQSPRANQWPHWLDKLADVADEVIRTPRTAPEQGRGEATMKARDEVTWNPQSRKWIASWLFVIVPLTLFIAAFGFKEFNALIKYGFIVGCVGDEDWGFLLKGWKAHAYLAVLLSPLALVAKMAHTMATRVHKPNFLLRLNLEGIALLAIAYFGLHVIQAIERSASHAC